MTLMLFNPSEYVPFVFVDHSIDCSYARKAANVQRKGGRLMLIASDSNILEEEYNYNNNLEGFWGYNTRIYQIKKRYE